MDKFGFCLKSVDTLEYPRENHGLSPTHGFYNGYLWGVGKKIEVVRHDPQNGSEICVGPSQGGGGISPSCPMQGI